MLSWTQTDRNLPPHQIFNVCFQRRRPGSEYPMASGSASDSKRNFMGVRKTVCCINSGNFPASFPRSAWAWWMVIRARRDWGSDGMGAKSVRLSRNYAHDMISDPCWGSPMPQKHPLCPGAMRVSMYWPIRVQDRLLPANQRRAECEECDDNQRVAPPLFMWQVGRCRNVTKYLFYKGKIWIKVAIVLKLKCCQF